jgi:uncharacterized protein (DUF927 family)
LNVKETWILSDQVFLRAYDSKGEEKLLPVCQHPIQPIETLQNIDTMTYKTKLGFYVYGKWHEVIVDRSVLANKNSIISLSDVGISVTSETSKYLSRYLDDVTVNNQDNIPTKKSITRLGWIPSHGFSPYDENLVFDGEHSFKQVFDGMTEKGSYDLWLDAMKTIRSNGITARILLASAFSSILVEPLKKLPFVVHLWGGTEVGKTVGLLMAASVWGNPNEGYLMKNFNTTNVGLELLATVYNSIPLCINELQITKETNMDKTIYSLCEGTGRTRGNKSLGIQRVGTWHNCILTNGEQPITVNNSGGGVVNRIVEIECKEALFSDPVKISNIVRENFGFAGKVFVQFVKDNLKEIQSKYDEVYKKMIESDTSDKQAMAASLIVTADIFATRLFFNDKRNVKVSEIMNFLTTKTQISAPSRAYEFLCQWIAINSQKFDGIEVVEKWGRYENEQKRIVFIVANKFDEVLKKEGFHSKPILSWLAENNLIEWNRAGHKKNVRINGNIVTCIALKLPQYNPFDDEEVEGEL